MLIYHKSCKLLGIRADFLSLDPQPKFEILSSIIGKKKKKTWKELSEQIFTILLKFLVIRLLLLSVVSALKWSYLRYSESH